MLTVVDVAIGEVFTVNDAVVIPARTRTAEGTSAQELEDVNFTMKPRVGAAWESVTVPNAVPPPAISRGATTTRVTFCPAAKTGSKHANAHTKRRPASLLAKVKTAH